MVNWSGSWAKTRKKTSNWNIIRGCCIYHVILYILQHMYIYIIHLCIGKTTPSSCTIKLWAAKRGLYSTYSGLPILEQINSATVSFQIYSYIYIMVRTLSRLYNIMCIYIYILHAYFCKSSKLCMYIYIYISTNTGDSSCSIVYVHKPLYIYVCYIHVLISLASWNISTRNISKISTHDIIYILCMHM
jgi:hypothetical protein